MASTKVQPFEPDDSSDSANDDSSVSANEDSSISENYDLPVTEKDEQNKDKDEKPKVNLATITWMRNSFKARKCSMFISRKDDNMCDTKGGQICQCGNDRRTHDNTSCTLRSGDTEWNVRKHTKEIDNDETFGEIRFTKTNRYRPNAKYIRVDVETDEEDLLKLINEHWKLDAPKVLISMTGGSKNFDMKPRLKEVFNRGLVKAAESTNAWIISAGTHTGVMKHVGEAVGDYRDAHGNHDLIVTMGIVPWGCITNRDQLTGKNGKVAKYTNTNSKSVLDYNHSHFILVDDGTKDKFYVELELRSKLEKAISEFKPPGRPSAEEDFIQSHIPTLCIILEGGRGSLETVVNAIKTGIPAVIIEGSGRAADILAYAYNQTQEEANLPRVNRLNALVRRTTHFEDQLKKMIRENLYKPDDRKPGNPDWENEYIDKPYGWVLQCIEQREYMTIFTLDDSGLTHDIDAAMLNALLKVNISGVTDRLIDKLNLALVWNRADVAEEKIFTDGNVLEPDDLNKFLYKAILQNKVDFVKLMITHGMSLKLFLTGDRLLKFYNKATNPVLCEQLEKFKRKQNKEQVDFSVIGALIKYFIGDFYKPLYLRNSSNDTSPNTNIDFKKPAREMFIWSILMLRLDMSVFFWEQLKFKTGIAASLTAQKLLNAMLAKTNDYDVIKTIQTLSKYYQDLSLGLLSHCYVNNPNKARDLLVKVQPNFGHATNLSLAIAAEDKMFISHTACQSLLTNIWMGDMTNKNGKTRLCICTVLFPLICSQIRWRDSTRETKSNFNDHIGMSNDDTKVASTGTEDTKSKSTDATKDSGKEAEANKDTGTTLTCMGQLRSFYNSPVIKFGLSCVSLLAFLILFSVVILTQFHPMPDITYMEMVLIAWIGMFIADEVRQIITSNISNLKEYSGDLWNVLDICTLVISIIGFTLRLIPSATCPDCFEWARLVLCINLMTFIFRVLHMFSVSKRLGPMLVMIGSMIKDMSYFMIILLVFIFAYGLALQGIMYPNSTLNIFLLRDVFYRAYWQMYGELFLEELTGDLGDCSTDPMVYNNISAGIPRCPENDWLGPVLLGGYILITNIMMLNLLIAIFSNTFANIQEKSDLYWNFQRYGLVREFYFKPFLPAPFIFIAHVVLLIRACYRKCVGCANKQKGNHDNVFKKTFDAEGYARELVLWERINAEEYLRSRKQRTNEQVDVRVKETNER